MRRTLATALTLTLALVALCSGLSGARTRAVDIAAASDVRLKKVGAGVGPGDVNGDGIPDVAVAKCGRRQPSAVYVVFGPFERGTEVDVTRAPGFVIEGPQEGEAPTCSPTAAGDVNGDGLGDVLLPYSLADNNGRASSGTAYVVFGKAGTDPVNLDTFDQGTQGGAGFRIDGAFPGSVSADTAAGLGDVNADGLDDVAVTAPFDGSAYVVFGKTDPAPVDLLRFALETQVTEGFRIDTGVPSRSQDLNVGSTGDVNGDGLADVGVGFIRTLSSPGTAFIVFGKTDPATVDTHDLGTSGFEVAGHARRSTFGALISEAGDVNRDGLSDVMISSTYRNCCGHASVYMIFGKQDTERLSTASLGKAGYRVIGGFDTGMGDSTSLLGDINCDGRSDMVVGEPASSHNGKWSGSIYVLYGKASVKTLKASDLGRHGFRIDGAHESDFLGLAVAGLGDVNGDGAPDLMTHKFLGGTVTYIVFGKRCRG